MYGSREGPSRSAILGEDSILLYFHTSVFPYYTSVLPLKSRGTLLRMRTVHTERLVYTPPQGRSRNDLVFFGRLQIHFFRPRDHIFCTTT